MQKFETISDQLNKQIHKKAIDATLDENGNIIPELPGMELNKAIFKEQFFTYFYQKDSSTIEVPVRTVYPKVDSELLTQIRSQNIGHYVTYLTSHNKERSHNISLATAAINNQVVLPGETFSFNQTVGKRTKAKGYLPAPIIVRGNLEKALEVEFVRFLPPYSMLSIAQDYKFFSDTPIVGVFRMYHQDVMQQLVGMDQTFL